MTQHRSFVLPSTLREIISSLLLDRETAHRFKSILRLRSGDNVELFDGEGCVVSGVLQIDKDVSLSDVQVLTHQSEPFNLSIVQAIVKMEKLEQIVQRCTELGVSEFILFDAERSTISFKDKMDSKIERLTRIAQDASRQSERVFVPRIRVAKLSDLDGAVFVGDPDAQTSLVSCLQNHSHLSVVIGPEGGLSPGEMLQLQSRGATPVKWAKHILRTETAGMAVAAVIGANL